MATLTGKQLKDSYQSLVTIKDADDANPTSGQLENGLGNAITALGIGTDSPATALDVAGTITSDGQVTNGLATFTNLDDSPVRLVSGTVGDKEALTFERSGGAVKGSIEYQQSPIGFNIGTDTVHDFRIKTDGTERMKIKSDGDISFQDGSTNEAFYWDASAGSLGIGTVPSTPLHVNATNANACIINVTGASPNYIFDIRDDNVSQFRVDSSGNVGIGTTSPDGLLNLAHQTSTNSLSDDAGGYALTFNFEGATNDYGRHIAIRDAGGDVVSAIGGFDEGTGGATGLYFATGNTTSIAERMRIDSSGNVGIGTTSPAGKLAVDAGNTSGTTIDGLHLGKNLTAQANYVAFQQGAIGWRVGLKYDDSNFPLCFFYGNSTPTASSPGSEVMRIDSSGNLLIGATATPTSSAGNIVLGNGTAPTGNATDGVILYAEDVSTSSELKVRDEAGNVTTLSPHNFSLIPDGASEPMAWAYYSERDGKKINVDMLKLARMVESLTGEKLVYEQ